MAAHGGHTRASGGRTVKMNVHVPLPLRTSLSQPGEASRRDWVVCHCQQSLTGGRGGRGHDTLTGPKKGSRRMARQRESIL